MNKDFMYDAIIRNYGKLLGVSTSDEFKSLLSKVEERLNNVILDNKKLPFLPVSNEEALVLFLSGVLYGNIPITLPKHPYSYMGHELKIVVFTYNQYE